MSTPLFIVVKTNGQIWATCVPEEAGSIGGTIFKVNSLARKTLIATATGTSAVSVNTKSGKHTEI